MFTLLYTFVYSWCLYEILFYDSKECWKVPTFSCRSHKGIKCHEYLDSHLVHFLSMICSLYFASHNLFWWRLKKKKKNLMLFLLIKWYFRKATYILSIFIRFQIKTNIEIVIFLDIKIAWHHIFNKKKIYIYIYIDWHHISKNLDVKDNVDSMYQRPRVALLVIIIEKCIHEYTWYYKLVIIIEKCYVYNIFKIIL